MEDRNDDVDESFKRFTEQEHLEELSSLYKEWSETFETWTYWQDEARIEYNIEQHEKALYKFHGYEDVNFRDKVREFELKRDMAEEPTAVQADKKPTTYVPVYPDDQFPDKTTEASELIEPDYIDEPDFLGPEPEDDFGLDDY